MSTSLLPQSATLTNSKSLVNQKNNAVYLSDENHIDTYEEIAKTNRLPTGLSNYQKSICLIYNPSLGCNHITCKNFNQKNKKITAYKSKSPYYKNYKQHGDSTEAFNRATSTQCGSPAYASPELLRNRPYDFKTDLWSL